VRLNISAVPKGWEASLDEEELPEEGYHELERELAQDVEYENLTLKVTAPNATEAAELDVPGECVFTIRATASAGEGGWERTVTLTVRAELRKVDLYVESVQFENTELARTPEVTVNVTVGCKYVGIKNVLVQLYADDKLVENKTISEIGEGEKEYVVFLWNASAAGAAGKGERHKFRVVIDPERTYEELTIQNNYETLYVSIGVMPPPPPFNWRPVIFVLGIIIVVLVLIGIGYLRRRKRVAKKMVA
jgi:hypothetical protein